MDFNLTNQFLIAMPAMADPFFNRTLVYICEHNEQGALGIIVNRPIDMSLATLFDKIDIKLEDNDIGNLPVYFGGPVQTDRGFVLHRPLGEWQSTLKISDDIGLSSSRDVLSSVAEKGFPSEIIVTLGYAGWEGGQLEKEFSDNAWLNIEADVELLFGLPPEDRLGGALQKLGISFSQLADVAGHA
jgi:putative transcriptional regulator